MKRTHSRISDVVKSVGDGAAFYNFRGIEDDVVRIIVLNVYRPIPDADVFEGVFFRIKKMEWDFE